MVTWDRIIRACIYDGSIPGVNLFVGYPENLIAPPRKARMVQQALSEFDVPLLVYAC